MRDPKSYDPLITVIAWLRCDLHEAFTGAIRWSEYLRGYANLPEPCASHRTGGRVVRHLYLSLVESGVAHLSRATEPVKRDKHGEMIGGGILPCACAILDKRHGSVARRIARSSFDPSHGHAEAEAFDRIEAFQERVREFCASERLSAFCVLRTEMVAHDLLNRSSRDRERHNKMFHMSPMAEGLQGYPELSALVDGLRTIAELSAQGLALISRNGFDPECLREQARQDAQWMWRHVTGEFVLTAKPEAAE